MSKLPPFLKDYDNAYERHKGANGLPIASVSYFANYLAQILSRNWRYEPFLKQWYKFDGHRWIEAESALSAINEMTLDLMQVEREFSKDGEKAFGSTFIPAVKRLLEADERIQIRIRDFDQQPELLNTPDGTIDLRTGDKLSPTESHFISRITGLSPIDDKNGELCPNYMRHLQFISNNDTDLIKYFELFSGYCLTGHIYLQEFYTWSGFGANGKSMLYKIWHYIMGEYAGIAASGQFSIAGRMAHKEQDLRLMGRRLVVSEEVSNWDLDKLKQFTDGGAISAREMHGKTTSFVPQFKLLFMTNNPPKLGSLDYGVERRLKMITFRNRITEDMRNPRFLDECLIPEAPYIMNRMVKHASEFLKIGGLPLPNAVKESSKDYFDSENITQQFVEDNCQADPDSGILFGDFYERMTAWCNKHGLDIPSKHKVGRQLTGMGYNKSREHDRRYSGIKWLETSATTYIAPYAGYHNEEHYG